MSLSAEAFDQILRALRSDATTQRNRRTDPRVGLRARVTIIPLLRAGAGLKPVDVWLRDLSRSGVGLLCSQQLKVQTSLVLELPRYESSPLLMEYDVMHCREMATGLYSVGAKFRRIITPEDVPGLAAALTPRKE